MGMVKRFLEGVAEELGELDITSPRVQAEASRRWDQLVAEEEKETEEALRFFAEVKP